jgi:hypothetical protein
LGRGGEYGSTVPVLIRPTPFKRFVPDHLKSVSELYNPV